MPSRTSPNDDGPALDHIRFTMAIGLTDGSSMRRIVITGLGAVTPLAAGVAASWSRLLVGRSGIRRLADDVVRDLPTKIGGVVPSLQDDPEAGFDPDAVLAPKEQRKVDRFILFALAAADEAVAQAKWQPISETDHLRTATIIASGIGGFPAITEAVRTVDRKGVRRLSPFTVSSFLANLAAGHISIRYGFKGPLGAPATACAAGIQAIGDATRLIRADEADVAVCGGTEACMNVVSLGGFAAACSLSTGFNETPDQASRPFDLLRDGFVMGEGAGILVIEELSHALARGAQPIAELVGYGTTADAHHSPQVPRTATGRGERWKSRSLRQRFRRARFVISMRTRPPHLWVTWVRSKRSKACSGTISGSLSAQRNPRPGICWARPVGLVPSSQFSRSAIRWHRRRSI
jgi:3-oxoacyl-[acyl-carrier-protein] synthase II